MEAWSCSGHGQHCGDEARRADATQVNGCDEDGHDDVDDDHDDYNEDGHDDNDNVSQWSGCGPACERGGFPPGGCQRCSRVRISIIVIIVIIAIMIKSLKN